MKSKVVVVIASLVLCIMPETMLTSRNDMMVFMSQASAVYQQEPAVYHKNDDGHFYVGVNINDQEVSFLMDTGATKTILSEYDARRLGIPLSKIRFTERFETPNGIISAAPIVIESAIIGSIILTNVHASITSTGIRQSILGMNVISMLDMRLNGNHMIIARKNADEQ